MKFAKLSLVAAVAVAGFTTANAQPLEEAIKGVDVSGSAVYRYNDIQDDAKAASKDGANNNYKVGLNLSSKVNDDVKFNTRFLATTDNSDGLAGPLDTSNDSDTNVTVYLSNANFSYTGLKNTTVTVGKQGLATPYTTPLMIDENEQTGTGILALSAIGPVTLGAGYFNQTNLNTGYYTGSDKEVYTTLNDKAKTQGNGDAGTEDISVLAAIATLGPVTLDAWYLDMSDLFKTYTVGAKYDVTLSGATLGATARYANLNVDWSDDKNDIVKVGLTGKYSIFSASADYAKTNKEGGITALDSDATTALKGWNLNSLNKTDADYYKLMVGVDILANLNLSANYGDLKYITAKGSTTDIEEEELYGQLTYKMSKNLTTYVRYGTYTKESTAAGKTDKQIDATAGRLQVAYTF